MKNDVKQDEARAVRERIADELEFANQHSIRWVDEFVEYLRNAWHDRSPLGGYDAARTDEWTPINEKSDLPPDGIYEWWHRQLDELNPIPCSVSRLNRVSWTWNEAYDLEAEYVQIYSHWKRITGPDKQTPEASEVSDVL